MITMTTITTKSENLHRVNGRLIFSHRIETVEKTGNGQWLLKNQWGNWELVGGRASGGASNEWWLISCENKEERYLITSATKAFHLLDHM